MDYSLSANKDKTKRCEYISDKKLKNLIRLFPMLKKYDEYEYIVNILNTKHFFFFRFCTNVIFVILIQFILAIEFKKKVMFMKSHTF